MRRVFLGTFLACALLGALWMRERPAPFPVKSLAWWQQRRPPSPFDRVVSTPSPELLDFLLQANKRAGFVEVPRQAPPDASFEADLQQAVDGLPDVVKGKARPWLLAILVVEELGGSGFTEAIYDEEDRAAAAMVVLDRHALDRNANAWATWKERTPFNDGGEVVLDATIEKAADDTRRSAIQYILLHELGHVLSLSRPTHPSWDLKPQQVTRPAEYPYFTLGWEVGADHRYHSIHDAAFPAREKVRYYARPAALLPATAIPDIYTHLEATGFPTLYAATGPVDDFADSFASYVHTVLMHRPWRVDITPQGGPTHTFEACWGTPRCAPRQAFLEQFLR